MSSYFDRLDKIEAKYICSAFLKLDETVQDFNEKRSAKENYKQSIKNKRKFK